MAENYPEEVLEKYLDAFTKALKKSLADADPTARNFSRAALSSISQKFPEEAAKLVNSLDATTRKQLTTVINQGETPGQSPLVGPTKKAISQRKPSVSRDEDIQSKDTAATANASAKNRTKSAARKPPSNPPSELPTPKISSKAPGASTATISEAGRVERKKSVSNLNGKDKGSQRSIEHGKDELKTPAKATPAKLPRPLPHVADSDFKDILNKLDHAQWNERMDALKSLEKTLGAVVEKNDLKKISEDNRAAILEKVVEKFEDQHAKVQEGAVRLVLACFALFEKHVQDHLSKVFSRVKLLLT
jgi:hypothetical protein